jgi:aspartate aminotransferase-like enzyme
MNKNDRIDFHVLNSIKANTFMVNAHETSTGRLYDLNEIGQFCHKNKLLNIVDAISAFVCDEVDMKKQHIDALILSSNKGLALPPGLAMVVLSPRAIKRIKDIPSMYFNFKSYLSNIKRGQTPFTPAVSIIKQLHYRLKELNNLTIKKSVKNTESLAGYFRKNIQHLPLKPYLQQMSNAMTSLTPTDNKKADEIIEDFEKRYNIIFLIKKLNHYYKCR